MQSRWLTPTVDIAGKLLWLGLGYVLFVLVLGGLIIGSRGGGWPYSETLPLRALLSFLLWIVWGYLIIRRSRWTPRRGAAGLLIGLVAFLLLQPLPA